MATRWNGTVTEWVERFGRWTDAPGPEAILDAAIFFDLRPVAGALDVAPLEGAVADAGAKPVFLRFLAKAALDFRPPPALVLTLRAGARVDLKAQGIAPVVALARCQGLEARSPARGTLERLEAAARAGVVDEGLYASVAEAYRFLSDLRLHLQLRDLAAGRARTNEVALSALTAVERSRLKDAFRAIRRWQERAVYHYRTDF
jgi:CBS domain-containing protein